MSAWLSPWLALVSPPAPVDDGAHDNVVGVATVLLVVIPPEADTAYVPLLPVSSFTVFRKRIGRATHSYRATRELTRHDAGLRRCAAG